MNFGQTPVLQMPKKHVSPNSLLANIWEISKNNCSLAFNDSLPKHVLFVTQRIPTHGYT